MINRLKNYIKKKKRLYRIFKAFNFVRRTTLVKPNGSKKKYPKVIQFPITYKCNSRCVMCNIWKMDSSNETTVDEFSKFLSDNIFKEVKGVGINGGEPTILKNLAHYVEIILKLPKIRSINMISNGLSTGLVLKSAKEINELCKKKGVKFGISISLDGVGKIHNKVRGVPYAFEKTTDSINKILENKARYCDNFELACTVVKQNVNNLMELETYCELNNYKIKYRLGIENRRIKSETITNQYSVLTSEHKQTAKEFFHYQMKKAKSLEEKFKYFSIFYWLNSSKPRRLLGCAWKDEGITLDSRGEIYYCATRSKSIGNLRKNKGEEIFFNKKNIEYRKSIVKTYCSSCIHDYSGKPQLKDVLYFLKHIIKDRFAMRIYRIKAMFLR